MLLALGLQPNAGRERSREIYAYLVFVMLSKTYQLLFIIYILSSLIFWEYRQQKNLRSLLSSDSALTH